MSRGSNCDTLDVIERQHMARLVAKADGAQESASASVACNGAHAPEAQAKHLATARATRSGRLFALNPLADVTNSFRGSVSIDEAAAARKGRTHGVKAVTASSTTQVAILRSASDATTIEVSAARPDAETRQELEWRASFEQRADIDEPYRGSVQLVPTYAQANAEHMREQELHLRPLATYTTDVQPRITCQMRAVLVDWLVEVADDFKLTTETLYLAVAYVDRFLSAREIAREELQLLGITCLLVAAKYEEIAPPPVERFAYVTDSACTTDDIVAVEAEVARALDFQLAMPTAKAFLQRFLRAAHYATQLEYKCLEALARYVLELSLLDFAMLAHRPSTVAAAALLLARVLLAHVHRDDGGAMREHVVWTHTLEHYAFHTARDLEPCARKMHKTLLSASGGKTTAIAQKYLNPRRGGVAALAFMPALPEAAFERFASFRVPASYFSHVPL